MFGGKILSGESYVLFIICAILLVMSVMSWTIAILKWRQFRAINMGRCQFLEQGKKEDLSGISGNNFLAQLQQLLRQSKKDYILNQSIREKLSLDAYIGCVFRKFLLNKQQKIRVWLSALASIGAMAPFIGLFGTVLGIYQSLDAKNFVQQLVTDEYLCLVNV
jgi:biopolymer transport protein ExbB/TolQ